MRRVGHMDNPPNPGNTGRANRVELILSQMESLPTLPAVAVRLVQLTTDKRARASQIINLIESDPALTAKVLKLARRADSGIRPDAARTVERAVVMLGFDTVRNTVLSIKVFEVFGPQINRTGAAGQAPTQSTTEDVSGQEFDRRSFWRHSLAVGCAAKLLRAASCQPRSIRKRPSSAGCCTIWVRWRWIRSCRSHTAG